MAMSKLEEAGFVVSDKQEESEDSIADGEERAAREREREKVAALEEIKESPPDEYGTLTIETFVVVSDPSEGIFHSLQLFPCCAFDLTRAN